MRKDRVIETLELLPEEFEAEELVEKLLFIEKVEKGRKDARQGKTLSVEDAKRHFEKKWKKRKSASRKPR